MQKVISELRREASDARQAAKVQSEMAASARLRAEEAETSAAQAEAYAQECDAAIARLSSTPTAAAA